MSPTIQPNYKISEQFSIYAIKYTLNIHITNKNGTNLSENTVSRLWGITAGADFLGFCDQKSSYKHVSDFGRL